jgi:hypothetical protein
MTEAGVPRSIDPETLAAGSGRPPWRGYRVVRRMTTAHPIRLSDEQGAVLNYGIDFGLRSRYELFTSALHRGRTANHRPHPGCATLLHAQLFLLGPLCDLDRIPIARARSICC